MPGSLESAKNAKLCCPARVHEHQQTSASTRTKPNQQDARSSCLTMLLLGGTSNFVKMMDAYRQVPKPPPNLLALDTCKQHLLFFTKDPKTKEEKGKTEGAHLVDSHILGGPTLRPSRKWANDLCLKHAAVSGVMLPRLPKLLATRVALTFCLRVRSSFRQPLIGGLDWWFRDLNPFL